MLASFPLEPVRTFNIKVELLNFCKYLLRPTYGEIAIIDSYVSFATFLIFVEILSLSLLSRVRGFESSACAASFETCFHLFHGLTQALWWNWVDRFLSNGTVMVSLQDNAPRTALLNERCLDRPPFTILKSLS